ncbi:MAG TPA: outer membrane beta-barrel protein [Thermoanaerobaculia bacterium]|jgi:opacity protein-like surface antigen
MKRALLVLLFALPLHADGFLRLAVGREQSRDTTLRDRDCTATAPPALFGCGFFAEGDFGKTTTWELGAGLEMSSRTRVDVSLARRGLTLDANANFTGVEGAQPVEADLTATSVMLNAALEVGPRGWRIQPFLTAGAGAARIDVDDVVYRFPGIGENAMTITQGGTFTSPAWSAGAGVTVDVTPKLAVDFAIRYSDLGDLRSDAGAARIVRPAREVTIDVAGTRANLETIGASIALRF